MKKLLMLMAILASVFALHAQSQTTKNLQDKYESSLSLYFYKNTLRMLNQKEDPDFDELIKNIEKLKFLMINKDQGFGANEYKKLVNDYKGESYEPILTSRFDGRSVDIYLNDKKGSTPGTVMLVNDSSSLYVLDMIGTIDMSKAGSLFSAIDGSTDVGQRIKDFANHGNKRKEKSIKID